MTLPRLVVCFAALAAAAFPAPQLNNYLAAAAEHLRQGNYGRAGVDISAVGRSITENGAPPLQAEQFRAAVTLGKSSTAKDMLDKVKTACDEKDWPKALFFATAAQFSTGSALMKMSPEARYEMAKSDANQTPGNYVLVHTAAKTAYEA